MTLQIDIMGTAYTLEVVPHGTDLFIVDNNLDGYCDYHNKLIRVADMSTDPDFKDDPEAVQKAAQASVTRHEIIHAYLNESGLAQCSAPSEAWAVNEEMVDWIAMQLPKIVKTCKDAGAL